MKEVTVKGLNICYNDEGEGKCVLLLHGWGANKESLNPIFNALKGTFRVIVPDIPGFGASDEPAAPWDAKDYADFLGEFIKALDIVPFAALGHSNGGRILIKASGFFSPEKLILMDSAGIKKKHGPVYYAKVYSYKLGKKILKLPLLNKTGLYEKLVKNAGSDDYKNSSPVMRATMSRLLSEDLTHMLSGIKSETLLIWGSLDTATPIADGRKMERLIKGSGLVEIAGGGHFSYLDNPGKAIGAINYFLAH
ncbi:MAG: alpha/beta hydrolase [Clostridia bacterium]|nr:alpha/beta hydrolase [Clostridia bacterium]